MKAGAGCEWIVVHWERPPLNRMACAQVLSTDDNEYETRISQGIAAVTQGQQVIDRPQDSQAMQRMCSAHQRAATGKVCSMCSLPGSLTRIWQQEYLNSS